MKHFILNYIVSDTTGSVVPTYLLNFLHQWGECRMGEDGILSFFICVWSVKFPSLLTTPATIPSCTYMEKFKHVQHTSGAGQLESFLSPKWESILRQGTLTQRQNLSQKKKGNSECRMRLAPGFVSQFSGFTRTLIERAEPKKKNWKHCFTLKKKEKKIYSTLGMAALLEYNQHKYCNQEWDYRHSLL